MTSAEFVNSFTGGILSLVSDIGILTDEEDLETDEYFALMLDTSYSSFLRNYNQYKNQFNIN